VLKFKKFSGVIMKRFFKITPILFAIGLIFISCAGDKEKMYGFSAGPWLTWSEAPSTSVTLNWVSSTKKTAEVSYGTDKAALSNTIIEKEAGRNHTVVINGLEPETEYFYSVKNSGLDDVKSVYRFKTAPVAGKARDFSFVVIGDKQPNPFSVKRANMLVSEAVAKADPDFICQVGDVASNGSSFLSWHMTLDTLPVMAAERPFMSAIGNHDYIGGGYDNFAAFFTYNYHNPINKKGKQHSMIYGDAKFIFVDNFDLPDDSVSPAQRKWVEKEMKEAQEDSQIKWIFVFMHHTFLTTGTSSRNIELQKWIIPLASKYEVDGLFFGHDHHYEFWQYQYGKNGYFYQKGDEPATKPLNIWCTGGGGAVLEIDYALMDHAVRDETMDWYNSTTGKMETIEAERRPWNPDRYIDHQHDRAGYGQLNNKGRNYYQLPQEESYCDDNDFYGYQYGEQAAHYMFVKILKEGSCEISVHYPNGELLTGPNGKVPQKWVFNK
jgi:hypothetical protein